MDSHRFDELTRVLAEGLDRRRALKWGAGGLTAGVLGGFRRSAVQAGGICSGSCTPGTDGDAQCRSGGVADCACIPDIQTQGGKPDTGTCGIVQPQVCSPEVCTPGKGEDGDAKCQAIGGNDCRCIQDAPHIQGGKPVTGTCGTGPQVCSPEVCTPGAGEDGDAKCQRIGGNDCRCQEATGTCGTDCVPQTCDEIVAECGPQVDRCGNPLDCGTCRRPGYTCDNGRCICPPGDPRCEPCVPQSKEEACAGLQCGTASDGCEGGRIYTCGKCPKDKKCDGRRCVDGGKRCLGKGLSGQPCSGKCKCKSKRRCHKGNCCQPLGDGSWHCNKDSDCCPGLTCARREPGQHKVCVRKPIGRATIPADQLSVE